MRKAVGDFADRFFFEKKKIAIFARFINFNTKQSMKMKSILCTLLLLCMALPISAKPKKSDNSTPKTVRFMDFNIADGMWKDQFNNYDDFVAWMKSQKVDIFAVCEAASHWNENKKSLPKNEEARYLPYHWDELAARWGHNYTALGAYQDNYPVAITSRFPIEVVQRLGGKQLSHGALHAKIMGVNYVVIHLWPQAYRKGDKTKTKGNGGNEFRLSEINYIMDQTIRNPKYANEEHWVMAGDFNSWSPKDSAFHDEIHGSNRKKRNKGVHNAVLNVYPHDVISDKNPYEYQASTRRGRSRIDFIYCTEKLYSTVKRAYTVTDDFVHRTSDHRPLVMIMKQPKKNGKK